MEFKNVKIIKKANVYFNGKVNSRTILFEDGERKTLGFMQKGEYEFRTESPEIMEVLNGEMLIKRDQDLDFIKIKDGGSFSVDGNSTFKVIINDYVDYCCSYK